MDKLIQHEMQYINMIYIIHTNSLIFINFSLKWHGYLSRTFQYM